jgi:hypothetical protein
MSYEKIVGKRRETNMNECVLVRAAMVVKDGKLEYVWESSDIEYYVEVLGYTFIGWEDMYI